MRSGLVIAPVVAALLVLSAQAGAAKPQPARVKYTPSPVLTLAQDGSRVAYISGGRVYVWNVAAGATSPIKGAYPSIGRPKEGPRSLHHEVAIAGTRVALVTRFDFYSGDNEVTRERLYTARVGGWAHRLGPVFASSLPGSGVGGWSGSLSAGPIGSGDLLALSTWDSDYGTTSNEALQLITPAGLQTIAGGPDAIVAESASDGRIAVLASASFPNTARIYSRTGTLLREFVPHPREIALSGNQLVVLTWDNTVDVYDWTTGDLLHTWEIATVPPNATPTHLAVYGRLAVYAIYSGDDVPRTLRLLDLETGRDVAIVRARGGGHAESPVDYSGHDAALGPRGLTYAVTYTTRDHPLQPRGKLVFVPTATLLGRVSQK